MYFSENLETCTIRWVLVCEDGVGVGKGNAFFYFGRRRRDSPPPPPALPVYPAGGDPSPSAPGTVAHHRQQSRPRQNQGGKIPGQTAQGKAHTSKRWTRCTSMHQIPDRPCWVDRTGCGRWRACNRSIMRIMVVLPLACPDGVERQD